MSAGPSGSGGGQSGPPGGAPPGGAPSGPPGFYGLGNTGAQQLPMPGLSPEQFALLLAQMGGNKDKDQAPEDRVITRFQFGVQHFVEHFLIIAARITSQNWPIWREYDKRIRRIIWADVASEQSINFVPSKLNTSILADAEVTITGKMGSASDFTTIQDSAWWSIVSASGADIVKLGKKFADSVTRAISSIRSPPTSPSSKDKGKRKREDDFRPSQAEPFQPFRGGDLRAGDGRSTSPFKPPGLNRPTFCIICRLITIEHGWQGCKRPANTSIQRQGAGWIWPGAKVAVCGKFNAGQEELGTICLYGHYCSQCGVRGHRAIEHGVASEAEVAATGGPSGTTGGGPSGTTGGTAAASSA